LHGWRFDLDTGRCLTADDRALRVRRRDAMSTPPTQ
jgi:nitrite reductase/ring-hydroxylating ferredoxin subunit